MVERDLREDGVHAGQGDHGPSPTRETGAQRHQGYEHRGQQHGEDARPPGRGAQRVP